MSNNTAENHPVVRRLKAACADMWDDLLEEWRQAEYERAKAAPLVNKLTRVMEEGKGTNYRYWGGEIINRKGQRVRYCWSVYRNAAGFYLGWRETWRKNGTVIRDRFVARRVRTKCKVIAQQRYAKAKE